MGFELEFINCPQKKLSLKGLLKLGSPYPSPNYLLNKFLMSKTCEKCGSPMRLRMARRGRNAGNPFWSCSRYPKCKSTKDVRSEDNVASQQIEELEGRGGGYKRISADQVLTQLRMRPLVGSEFQASGYRKLKFQTHHPLSALDVFDCRGALADKIQNSPVRNWGIECQRPSGTILEEEVKRIPFCPRETLK